MTHLGSIVYIALLLIAAAVMSGCAGLQTTWVLHMEYRTPVESK
jgi:hypothetical protein